jgi:hypothetical protein
MTDHTTEHESAPPTPPARDKRAEAWDANHGRPGETCAELEERRARWASANQPRTEAEVETERQIWLCRYRAALAAINSKTLSPAMQLEQLRASTTRTERAALHPAVRRALAELDDEESEIAEHDRLHRGVQLRRSTIAPNPVADDLDQARRERNARTLVRAAARVDAAVEKYRRHLQDLDSQCMPRKRAPSEGIEMGDARRIRQRSASHQTQGPPPPNPLVSAIEQTMCALAVLREQMLAASSAPPVDDWIGQRKSPIPPRCHTRLCRELMARGDARAAIDGRDHLLQRSALDEYLRGKPRAEPPKLRLVEPEPSAGEKLERELAELFPTAPESRLTQRLERAAPKRRRP